MIDSLLGAIHLEVNIAMRLDSTTKLIKRRKQQKHFFYMSQWFWSIHFEEGRQKIIYLIENYLAHGSMNGVSMLQNID